MIRTLAHAQLEAPAKFTFSDLLLAFLTRGLPALFLALACVTASAQTIDEDDGEFEEGAGLPAENTDSELVPNLGFSTPSYSGTGCPAGSASVALSPDQRTLSILFDSYVARAGGETGEQRAVANCDLRIPFQVPEGYRVQVVKLDYRGYAFVPQGGRAAFVTSIRALSTSGGEFGKDNAIRLKRRRVIQGPREKNFHLASRARGPKWSPCGQSFVLAADSELRAKQGKSEDGRFTETLATIDSLDTVSLPVQVSLRWKKCQKDGGPQPGPKPKPGKGKHF